jgi:putative chitobiose transport system permease protein
VKVSRWLPWIYALPMIAFVIGIFAYPILSLFRYSLENVGTSPYLPTTYAGLGNFRYIFGDSLFATALTNNLKLFLCVPIMVALSIILSALLFDRPRGWKVYRTLLFIPYVLSIPVVGVVFGYVFQYQGVLNSILRSLGLDLLARDWLGSPTWALPTIMFVIIWKELGFGIVLCLARLMSVSEEYFESARVDGARWWQILRHVTIPQLAPALAFYAVVELSNMLAWVCAYVYVMTLGGPMNSTVVTEFYIYQQVFTNDVVGVGAAAGVILLGVVAMLIAARSWMEHRFAMLGYE